MKPIKIIVAGDLLPSNENYSLFEIGNTTELYGKEICQLFAGADIITAQHTHCNGCEEWYNGTYLLYGQGNFLFSR